MGRTDVEADTPILWPPDGKSWLIWIDPDPGKDWRWEEKGTTEDEMIGWHHRLSGHEFEENPGVGNGQGRLVCCSPWGCKESDMTEQLNWTDSLPRLPLFSSFLHYLAISLSPVPPGLPRWQASGKESTCQCRRRKRHGFYTWVGKDPLEEDMATHSNILAWRIPWIEEPGGL